MNRNALASFWIVFAFILPPCLIRAENWPAWRGPDANGVSRETNLPTEWSAKRNIAWKTPLNGEGASTPIVWEDRIFLTEQIGRGPVAGARPGRWGEVEESDDAVRFRVFAVSAEDGSLLWEHLFEPSKKLTPVHEKHNLSSPSPVTDGERVITWFATGRLTSFDLDGNVQWERHLGEEIAPFDIKWGHGSSPALYGDRVYLLCDHGRTSYLMAVDKRTGETLWQIDRGSDQRSYTTPIVIDAGGRKELIVNARAAIEALDPDSGETLWTAGEPNRVPVPMPVAVGDVLYSTRGYRSGPYMAIRAGNLESGKERLIWDVESGAPYVSSILHYEGLLYLANDSGIVRCIDPKNGETIWTHRAGGYFSASPVGADGKIYCVNEGGETFVYAAGRELKLLAQNEIDERTLASPAVADGRIFIRTDGHLYCIGARKSGDLES